MTSRSCGFKSRSGYIKGDIRKIVSLFISLWINDVYVNPSNNGNLQSAYYKDIKDAIRRSNEEFLPIFNSALAFAQAKKKAKAGDIISDGQGNHLKKINKRWTEVDAQGNKY